MKSLTCGLFALALYSSSGWANGCRTHNVNDPSVPECPRNGGTLLNEGYPAMAVTVTDDKGGAPWVRSFVMEVLRAQPQNPPQFFITMEPGVLKELQSAIAAEAVDANTKRLWLSSLSRVEEARYHYQQDFFQPMINPATGRPSLREVERLGKPNQGFAGFPIVDSSAMGADFSQHYPGSSTNDVFNVLSEGMKKECDIDRGPPIDAPVPFKGGYMGGNLEGGPLGLCLVGTDGMQNRYSDFAKQVCGNVKPLAVPTSHLTVGHTDESVATVRTGPGECDFAVLVESPATGLNALLEKPNEAALQDLPADLKLRGKLFPDDICRAFFKYLENSGNPPKPAGSKSISRGEWFGWNMAWAAESNDGLEKCSRMTNIDLVNSLKAQPDYQKFTAQVQRSMDSFKERLRADIRKLNPKCRPKVIDVPTVYGEWTMGKNPTGGRTFHPDMVNLQQFGKRVLIPDPHNATLRAKMEKEIKALGLEPRFLDTAAAHANYGNLHCSTNAVRYCRPRKTRGTRG
jgi:hypothetical protein